MRWWALKKSLHVSWAIAAICWGIIIGVICAQHVQLSEAWSYAGILLALGVLWKRRLLVVPVAVGAGLLIGLTRGSAVASQLTVFSSIHGHDAVVKGLVIEDPERGKGSLLTLKLSELQIDRHEVVGLVWASVQAPGEIRRGDTVTLQGRVGEGFGNISAAMYRVDVVKVERPVPGDLAGRARDWFSSGVRASIPEPGASLGIGYVVGQRSALPADLDLALTTAGLTHIVVASGYNLTILVRLARRLFQKVSKYLSALAAGCMILAFIAITGLSPSMARAGLVAGLSLLAWYYGRRIHPLVLLPFAAAITLLINPSYGWNDLGWALSFAAFGGVMIVAPLLQRYFFGDKKPRTVRQIVGETIGAELATLPLLALAFGHFSNVGLIANVLVLPFIPLTMLLTFIAGATSIAVPAVASVVGLPAAWVLEYMIGVAQYMSKVPWVQTNVTVDMTIVGLYYLVLSMVCIYIWRKTRYNLRDTNIVE